MSPHAQLDRVLILDDHVIIRRGLRNLLMLRMPHLQVDDVGTLREMFAILDKCPIPALLVLDLQLPDGNAMEHIEAIRRDHRAMGVLVYSMSPERIYAQRVLALGCSGYLSKEASENEVIRAVRTVLSGRTYRGSEMEMLTLDHPHDQTLSPFDRLSKQELLVLDQILAGRGVKEMSKHMGLSTSTVATYKARLFEKLNVSNSLELQTLVNAHGYRR